LKEEFAGWLRQGLGRAAVFLTGHDSVPYREILLHACTHNLAYNPCEDSRVPYLLDLIGSVARRKLLSGWFGGCPARGQ
jgi:hypothetical protein